MCGFVESGMHLVPEPHSQAWVSNPTQKQFSRQANDDLDTSKT
jgi:hypothetical protein